MPTTPENDRRTPRQPLEDVERDPNLANSRPTGGKDSEEGAEGDAPSTTGTGVNEDYVGRAAGDDEGYVGETGAEARGAD